MPRVVTPDYQVGLAQPTQARFQAADNGGGVAGGVAAGLESLGQAGSRLANVQADIAEQHAITAAKEADTTYAAASNVNLYDPEHGYLNQLGRNAVTAYPAAVKVLTQSRDEIAGSLESDLSKEKFLQSANARIADMTGSMDRHLAQQNRVWLNSVDQARQDQSQSDAVIRADDPPAADMAIATMRGSLSARLTREGADPETIGQQQDAQEAKTRLQIIDRLANTSAASAQAYLDHYRDGLTGEAQSAAEKTVRIASQREAVAQRRVAATAEAQTQASADVLLADSSRGVQVDPAALHTEAARVRTTDPARAAKFDAAGWGAEETAAYGNGNATPAQMTAQIAQIEGTKDWQKSPELVAKHDAVVSLRAANWKAQPNFPTISLSDPDAVRQRLVDSDAWARTHNGDRFILGPDQAASLQQQMTSDPKGRLAAINTLAALPSGAGYDALRQIAPNDAGARRMIALPQPYRVLVADGAAARKDNTALVDGPNSKDHIGTAQQSLNAFNRYVGPAMSLLDPTDRAAAMDAARSIQASFQFHNSASYSDSQMYASVHQAMGGTRDGSGTYRGGLGEWHGVPVMLPAGVSSAQLQQHMANLSWGDSWAKSSPAAPVFRGGQAMTADQVKASFTPVVQPDGRYRFLGPPVPGTATPSVIHRRDGQVWTVRIDGNGLHP